jgi:predicted O-methyltransferase YrrM
MMSEMDQNRFLSGLPAVDAYLDHGFDEVRGMSSRFATAISARLLAIQTELGISGGFVEIGAFMGRYLIAMAKALKPDDKAVGIDHFEWPNAEVIHRFQAYCDRFGIVEPQRVTIKGDSRALAPADIVAKASGKARLVHVDGEHTIEHLTKDLELAAAIRHELGLIIVDDMLHPGYPMLVQVAIDFLGRHPDLCIVAVIDRQDIVGAAKFVIGSRANFADYEHALRAAFPQYVWGMRSEFPGYAAMVLTPRPMLAAID